MVTIGRCALAARGIYLYPFGMSLFKSPCRLLVFHYLRLYKFGLSLSSDCQRQARRARIERAHINLPTSDLSPRPRSYLVSSDQSPGQGRVCKPDRQFRI
jgi:hypothetical protein